MNEEELIEKARAAQAEREREAAGIKVRDEQRKEQLSMAYECTSVYMIAWAKRFRKLAKKVGLRRQYYVSRWRISDSFDVGEDGRLYNTAYTSVIKVKSKYKEKESRNISREFWDIAFGPNTDMLSFSETEMRQRVDKLFEDALMRG